MSQVTDQYDVGATRSNDASLYPHSDPPGTSTELSRSVLAAIAYADLFDYPLTPDEIARYQVGTAYPKETLRALLAGDPYLLHKLAHRDGMYALRGREQTFERRASRERASRRLWKRASLYLALVSRMPFVRMVAVTGALAVNNVAGLPDIDLLVVAKQGRVWICRRFLVAVVRLAGLLGDNLCPNYVLSESKLDLEQRDFYTAHELAQMVAVYGHRLQRRMIAENRWALPYLPCAFAELPARRGPARRPVATRALELLLSRRAFDRWERWELRRLRAKLRPHLGDVAEVVCSPDQCKGHTGHHRASVMVRYGERLSHLGLYEELRPVLYPHELAGDNAR